VFSLGLETPLLLGKAQRKRQGGRQADRLEKNAQIPREKRTANVPARGVTGSPWRDLCAFDGRAAGRSEKIGCVLRRISAFLIWLNRIHGLLLVKWPVAVAGHRRVYQAAKLTEALGIGSGSAARLTEVPLAIAGGLWYNSTQ